MPNTTAEPTRILISYSHDSAEHDKRVLNLADRLCGNGIDTELDQYISGTPSEGWPNWMTRIVKDVQFVLVVCTATYYKRATGEEKKGVGKGVKWESLLSSQAIYDNNSENKKFIPILFADGKYEYIPDPLRPVTHYYIDDDEQYQNLYRYLTDQPKAIKPKLGKPLELSPQNTDGQPPAPITTPDQANEPVAVRLTVPFLAEPDIFVGREKELKQLTEALSKPGSVHAVSGKLVNLIGLGGIGKTTLAREALKRCKDNFPDGCFEIRLEGMSPQAFAVKLNGLLNQPPSEPADVEQAQLQITHLLNEHQILLLLDNVIDANELLQVLPQSCKSSIIVTSRDLDLADAVRITRPNLHVSDSFLEVFNGKECLSLFEQLLGGKYQTEQEDTYLAIAEQLGFLPIALRLAISTLIFGPRHSPTQLLSILKSDQKLKLIDTALKHDANSDERSIFAVFDLSAPLLDESLKQTLAELAVCAPGPVPVDFLQHLTEQDDLADSLETLVRYSWCKQICVDDVQHYELHQLVRELIQEQLVGDELRDRHVDIVHHLFIEEPAHFLELERWLGQADLILPVLKERKDRRLVYWASGGFCVFCKNRGYGERFITICQWVIESFQDNKADVAIALGNQALLIRDFGRLDDAMALHQNEEAIHELMGAQVSLAICYGNQATIHLYRGKFDKAMALRQKEEVICEEMGDRAGLSRSYGNQALILRARGQLDEAMTLHQKEEAICEARAEG
ncbi:MAG: AAA family ATPase, partial [Algicola sp.]|nr:AAA family ATPase [Algicola sp.]